MICQINLFTRNPFSNRTPFQFSEIKTHPDFNQAKHSAFRDLYEGNQINGPRVGDHFQCQNTNAYRFEVVNGTVDVFLRVPVNKARPMAHPYDYDYDLYHQKNREQSDGPQSVESVEIKSQPQYHSGYLNQPRLVLLVEMRNLPGFQDVQ